MRKNLPRVLVAYNSSWYVWIFRMAMIRALRAKGYEVIVLAPRDEYTNRITAEGFACREIRLRAKGRNPFQEILAIGAFLRAYREICPDIVLHFTIKPNLYGSLAARALGIPAINNVTGLGAVFDRGGVLQSAVRLLYKAAFARVERVFFQNPDDREAFVRGGLVKEVTAGLLPGLRSGPGEIRAPAAGKKFIHFPVHRPASQSERGRGSDLRGADQSRV